LKMFDYWAKYCVECEDNKRYFFRKYCPRCGWRLIPSFKRLSKGPFLKWDEVFEDENKEQE